MKLSGTAPTQPNQKVEGQDPQHSTWMGMPRLLEVMSLDFQMIGKHVEDTQNQLDKIVALRYFYLKFSTGTLNPQSLIDKAKRILGSDHLYKV